jgi:hypothetical protein
MPTHTVKSTDSNSKAALSGGKHGVGHCYGPQLLHCHWQASFAAALPHKQFLMLYTLWSLVMQWPHLQQA